MQETPTLTQCAAHLALWHSDIVWTDAQVQRCQAIFKTLLSSANHLELFGNKLHVCLDFSSAESWGVEDLFVQLLGHPRLLIVCFDIAAQQMGPKYMLTELLEQDQAYEKFARFWTSHSADAALPDSV